LCSVVNISFADNFITIAVDYNSNVVNYKANAVDYKAIAVDYKAIAVDYKAFAVDYKANAVDYKTFAVDYKANAVDYKANAVDYNPNAVNCNSLVDSDFLFSKVINPNKMYCHIYAVFDEILPIYHSDFLLKQFKILHYDKKNYLCAINFRTIRL
jgi:hypothetical protein